MKNSNKKLNKKIYIVAVLALCVLLTFSSIFVYWYINVSNPDNGNGGGTVTVGTGDIVTTQITLTDGFDQTLFPVKVINGSQDADDLFTEIGDEVSYESVTRILNTYDGYGENNYITYKAVVSWVANEPDYNENDTATLNVTHDIVWDTENQEDLSILQQYVYVYYTPTENITLGVDLTFKAVVFMLEPENKTHYDLVTTTPLSLSFTFEITV